MTKDGGGIATSLQTAPPVVTLRNAPAQPFDGAIAAARTCYSPRVIAASEVTDRQRDSIGALTFDAGHHTVYQHAHFEFGLENISRQFVWTVLHSYPFYNSEQSSQRYVKLKEPRAFVPPITGEALDVYERAILSAWDSYAELSALLKDDAFAILKELRYVTPTRQRRAAEGDRAGRREARHRDGALRDSDRRVHVDGAHHLRHRAAPAAADGGRRRRAVRGARRHRRRWCDLVREVDPFFFEKVGLRRAAGRRAARDGASRARAPAATRSPREFDAPPRRHWSRACVDCSPSAPKQSIAESVRVDLRPDARRDGRRRGDRSGDEPGAEPLSPRRDERLVSLAADARAASRVLRVREAAEPHRRLAGSAAPHGAGVAAADDVRRHGRARLRHAAADRRQPAGAGGVRTRDARGLGRQEPAARARRAARVRALRAAEREDAAVRRIGIAPRAAAQVDAAHLLQRAGRDLPGVDGRVRAGPRGASAARRATSARPASSATA